MNSISVRRESVLIERFHRYDVSALDAGRLAAASLKGMLAVELAAVEAARATSGPGGGPTADHLDEDETETTTDEAVDEKVDARVDRQAHVAESVDVLEGGAWGKARRGK